MNNHIERIKQLEEQRRVLKTIIGKEEYKGAGISLSLCVGPFGDENPGLDMELTEFLPDLLALMDASLAKQIEIRYSLARRDLNELNAFFGMKT